jgi:hypothetical protein
MMKLINMAQSAIGIFARFSKVKTRALLYMSIFFSFAGCYTHIDHQSPQMSNLITVNSILQEGYPVKVHVTMAGKLDTVPVSAIENAQVELYIDGVFAEQLNYMGNAFYMGETVVEGGKEYLCKVAIPDTDTLSCKDEIPLAQKIIDIEHINIAGKDEEGTSYPAMKITFNNNPDELTYYELQIMLLTYNNELSSANIINVVDPIILNEGLPILLFSNELITDSVYTMHINYTTGGSFSSNGSAYRTSLYPFILELRTVSCDYYRFRKQYYLYEQGRFANGITETMTSAPLFSNVKNGTGIFAGYSSMLSDTIKPAYER